MTEKRILLVEDNPDDEELTLLCFKKSRILNEVVVTRDGVETLEYLFGEGKYIPGSSQNSSNIPPDNNLSHLPQLILLDLKLPKLSGLEVLQRLRADPRTQFIPVVILTSSSEEEDVISAFRLGANSYVRKPVDFRHFADTMQQLVYYWLQINETPNQP
jgi:two-component system, response regulator